MPKLDPYARLQVRRNASKAVIRKAYRALALETHPDRGGDRSDFQEIQLAYDVLIDDARRAHFDATGEIDGGVDNRENSVMSVVAEALQLVVLELLKQGADPEREDMVAHLRTALQARNDEMAKAKAGQLKAKAFLEGLLGRFEIKGPNALELMVRGQIAAIDRSVQSIETHQPVQQAAVEFVERYRFKFKKGRWAADSATTAGQVTSYWAREGEP